MISMDVSSFYKTIGGEYEDVLSRLGTEEKVKKFVRLFFLTGDFESLEIAINKQEANEAFEFSHSLKGNSLNIGFTRFTEKINELVTCLRPRVISDVDLVNKLFSEVKQEYNLIKSESEKIM